jgi:hypothetical protein
MAILKLSLNQKFDKLEEIMNASFKDNSLQALIYTTRKALDFSDIMADDVIKIIDTTLVESLEKNRYLCINEESVDKIIDDIQNKMKTTKMNAKILFSLFVGWLISKNETCFECSDGKSKILVVPSLQGRSLISLYLSCE